MFKKRKIAIGSVELARELDEDFQMVVARVKVVCNTTSSNKKL